MSEDPIENIMPLPVLTEVEIEVARQRRAHVSNFVRLYQGMNDRKPSDAKIARHLEYWGKSNDVSWIRLDDPFKVKELDQKGI